MRTFLIRLSKNKFYLHLLAFCIMILIPALLYFAAQRQATVWVWSLIVVFSAANLLVIVVR